MAKKSEKIKAKKKEATVSFFQKHLFELIIVGFCFALYSNSLFNGYNMDDELVTRNHRLTSKGISAIPEIFTSPYYQDDMGYAYEYRPVVLASFAIEHSLFGDNPFVSHLINLILYALCCVLLFKVLQAISVSFTPLLSFSVTLLFAAHTSHTEVVDSIKNRDEILGLIFCLYSVFVSFKAIQTRKKKILFLLPLVFTLALMNKITFLSFAVIIPFALLIFTEIGFFSVLIVSFLLALPAFFILNLPDLFFKLEIVFGLITATVLMFLVLRYTIILEGLKRFFDSAFKKDSIQAIKNDETENWKDFFKNTLPTKGYFKIVPALFSGILGLVFILGIVYNNLTTSALSACLLLFVIYRGYVIWAWWTQAVTYILLILIFPLFPNLNNNNFIYPMLGYSLSYFLVFGKKNMRIPTALALLLTILLSLFLTPDIGVLICPPFMAALKFNKAKLPSLIIVILLAIVTTTLSNPADAFQIKQAFSNPMEFLWWTNNHFGIFIFLVLLFAAYINKGAKTFALAYIAIPILVLLFVGKHDPQVNPFGQTRDNIVAIGKNVNTNVLQEKLDRPIHFVEQPISYAADWQTKTGTSLHVLLHYFTKTILPYPLAFYYGYKFISPEKVTGTFPLISMIIYLTLLATFFYFLRRNLLISFGIGVYLISLTPFADYFFPIPGIVGDRYMLIPSIGWSILLALILSKMGKVNDQSTKLIGLKDALQLPPVFKFSFAGILCLYSLLTFSRNFDWKDDLTLMKKDIKYVTNSSQAHNLLAVHLMKSSFEINDAAEQNKMRYEAIIHFKSAIEIYPPFYNVAFDLGRTYATLNIPDSAIIYFKGAIAIDSTNSDAHLFVAKLLVENKRNTEAIPYFESRIQKTPSDYVSYETLSYLYFTLKDYEKSIAVNTAAAQQFPSMPDPLINIGRAFVTANKPDSAKVYLQKALIVSPNNTVAMQLLEQVGVK